MTGILAGLLTLYSAGCFNDKPNSRNTNEPEKSSSVDSQKPAIDLDSITLDGAYILDKNVNPASDKYVAVVLTSYARDGEGNANESEVDNQLRLYNAGISLVQDGFTNIYTEDLLPKGGSLNSFIELKEKAAKTDFSRLFSITDHKKAQELAMREYIQHGIDPSLLLFLTYNGRLNFDGAESSESIKKQMEYDYAFTIIYNTLQSGESNELAEWYRAFPKSGKRVIQQFNEAIRFVTGNYGWWMYGRSREMVDNVLEDKTDNGILFVGANHYESVREALVKSA